MTPFVHLHVHSQYSILDGQASIKGLVDKAIANGMRGMALTDHGNMFGIKELHDYCNKINSKIENESDKFKPIFGCEVYVADTDLHTHVDKRDIGRHLILLAKNMQGYKNLIKIVSKAWTEGFYSHPRTDKHELELHHEGIICCSACLGGEIPRLIMNGEIEKAREMVKWYQSVYGEDYYLELQRHKATVQRAAHDTFPRQQEVNAVLMKFSKELGIKLICTNDVHFVNEDDADAHERLICVSTGKKMTDDNILMYTKQEWF